jgi:hypothetical protein
MSLIPRLNLRQKWVAPLLQFRRLTRAPPYSDKSARLDTVDITFRSGLSDYPFAGNQELKRANQDLHQLFGEAIRDALLGISEEMAMKAFMEKWEGEYAMWQHHLSFGPTGW